MIDLIVKKTCTDEARWFNVLLTICSFDLYISHKITKIQKTRISFTDMHRARYMWAFFKT